VKEDDSCRGLQLDNYEILNEQVNAEADIDADAVVCDRKGAFLDKFPSLRHGRVTQRFIPIHRITRPTLRPQSNTRLPGMPVAGKVWLEPSRV
jgi:hypothetical protein